MTKKIFRSICLVALLVFGSSIALVMGVLYDYFSDVQLHQLKIQTNLVSQSVAHEGIRYFDGLDPEPYRITWIRPDGTILYDSRSDTASMENHLERTEIRQALTEGYGESDRYSATLMERSFYCARRLDDGSVLRLSTTHGTIFVLLLGMSQPIFLVFAIAVGLSVILAARISGNIVKPLNQLDLDHPLETNHYEELSPLLLRISSQQNQLRLKEVQIGQKQEELHAVISNMKEGMILLSKDKKIISINRAAVQLFDASQTEPSGLHMHLSEKNCIGKQLSDISGSQTLLHLTDRALHGYPQEQTISLQNSRYQITASPIASDSETAVFGAALFFFDVTEKENAEQMRREFTANVSHELKTPLHAISGYAELILNNMVKKEDLCSFASKIYTEAQRMARLVEDIINLSHLDEGTADMQFEPQDLMAAAAAAVQSLSEEAADMDVTVTLSGEAVIIDGIGQLLFGIIFNLCDNAIKYNKKGGSVQIEIHADQSHASLSIHDTGIGIPPEHQAHIFERFYRVDKSRSRQSGGTGLGLSIVKHAANIHHANITLQSIPDKGTTITVIFPRS